MELKKYIIFSYYTYYPDGGIGDLRDESYDDLEECVELGKRLIEVHLFDHVVIVEHKTMKEVERLRG